MSGTLMLAEDLIKEKMIISLKNLMLSLVIFASWVFYQVASINETFTYRDNKIQVELVLLKDSTFTLSIRETLRSCYTEGIYHLMQERLLLNGVVSEPDSGFGAIRKAMQCKLDSSLFTMIDSETIRFDSYVLKKSNR